VPKGATHLTPSGMKRPDSGPPIASSSNRFCMGVTGQGTEAVVRSLGVGL
jgi:hypothetical protein